MNYQQNTNILTDHVKRKITAKTIMRNKAKKLSESFDLTSYDKNVKITFSTDLDVCPSYVQSCFHTESDISALITDKNKNGKFYQLGVFSNVKTLSGKVYFNVEFFQIY
jgi:hypothetical protein